MREHKLKKHDNPEDCPQMRGESVSCNICELSWCNVCNGAEASLPTECPGRKMTLLEEDMVQAGHLDFKNGRWEMAPNQRKCRSCGAVYEVDEKDKCVHCGWKYRCEHDQTVWDPERGFNAL